MIRVTAGLVIAAGLVGCATPIEERLTPTVTSTDAPTVTSTLAATPIPSITPTPAPVDIQIVEPTLWGIPAQTPDELAVVLDAAVSVHLDGLPEDHPLAHAHPVLAQAFLNDPLARDLLVDHRMVYSVYELYDDGQGVSPFGGAKGDVTLVGQAVVNGRHLRYSVDSPFLFEQGEMVYWSLSREKLVAMITDILGYALMWEFWQTHPTLVLNMFYAEHDHTGQIWQPAGLVQNFTLCGILKDLPTETEPLRGFGFGDSFWVETHHTLDFLLIDGRPEVYDLWLHPPSRGDAPYTPVYELLPPELKVDEYPLIGAVRIDNKHKPFFNSPVGGLEFLSMNPLTQDEVRQLQPFADQLPISVTFREDYHSAGARGVGFVLPEEGHIEMMVCED